MPQKRSLHLQKATVEQLATCKATKSDSAEAKPEHIERIKKCLDRANHANANQAEAQAAMRMASKIMETHKIELAQVMQYENAEEQADRAGFSTVKVEQPHGAGLVKHETWVDDLERAVSKFFDCKAYSNHGKFRMLWTFYGIADHTVTAALAFEVMHTLILDGSTRLIGVTTRNSFCLGAAMGLYQIADQENKAVEVAARLNEERQKATQMKEEHEAESKKLGRLQPLVEDAEDQAPSSSEDQASAAQTSTVATEEVHPRRYSGSFATQDGTSASPLTVDDDEESWGGFSDSSSGYHDEDDADINAHSDYTDTKPMEDMDAFDAFDAAEGDFEENLQRFTQPTRPDITTIKSEPTSSSIEANDAATPQWQNTQQLTVYKQTAMDVCDAWLKENKTELKIAKARKRSIKDHDAFERGQEESKEIHAKSKRKRIEGGNQDVPKQRAAEDQALLMDESW